MKISMKSKTKILIFLTLLISFLFSGIFNSRFSKNIITNNNYLEFNENNKIQIKQSGFWNLTGSPIFIDDLDPNFNWSKTASENEWCTGLGTWNDPFKIENITIDGQDSSNCIEIKNSDAYFIIRNCSLNNSGSYSGIELKYVDNGKIINNTCSDNNIHGINLRYSNNNNLSGNNACNNSYGIYLSDSDNNMLSGNTASNNDFAGIDLAWYCHNNMLSGNLMNFCGISLSGYLAEVASHIIDNTNLVNNKSVYYYVNEIGLGSKNFTNAGQIILINCNNSIISGFNLSNCTTGIYLGYSNNNTISRNTAKHNNKSGIHLEYSDGNTFSGNTVNNNSYGILFYSYDDDNTISGNNASNNFIELLCSDENTILGNVISNNSKVRLDSSSNNNKIFLNHFVNNEIGAEDNGINNTWDNGIIGNYWDDYDGVDANDDGIGDTPYIISGTAGSHDNFPIWTNGDDIAPVITIISPLPDSIFGLDAPNYNLSIDELNLDTIWYTLDGGITNYTITGLTGTFNQTAWEGLSEGSLTIRFYANDTAGNIGFIDVEVIIEIPEDINDLPIISFGNYYILFTFITILSFIILEKRKKK